MRKPAIGILAGMGPRSTAPFIDMVIDECQKQYDAKVDIDFPPMFIYSLPTPFYADRPLDHELLKRTIITGLRDLERTGVDFISMPCNTAHLYFEELKNSINVPLLNIVDETLNAIPANSSNVSLLATRATVDAGIYQPGIVRAGFRLTEPGWQVKIDQLILDIKADRHNKQNAVKMKELLMVGERFGADCVIIGCTDLTPVALACGSALVMVDSARCLAKATIAHYLRLSKGISPCRL